MAHSALTSDLLILTYGDKSIFTSKRKPDYDEGISVRWKDYYDIIQEVRQKFDGLHSKSITLVTNSLNSCQGQYVTVTDDGFHSILRMTTKITALVAGEPMPNSNPPRVSSVPPRPTTTNHPSRVTYSLKYPQAPPFSIRVKTLTGYQITITDLGPDCPIIALMAWLSASQNIPMSQQNLIFGEAQLQESNAKTLAEVGIMHQSIIELKKLSTPGNESFARNSKVRRHTSTNAGVRRTSDGGFS
ncbi:hypothetical protein C8J56DRAFT_941772 [Mycena floridula]|nr:hypothetical protein C8J56DRAFT_941772 [Mycena floridula]